MSAPAFSVGPFRFADELTAAAAADPALCRASLALRLLSRLAHNAARTGACYRSLRRLAEELGADRKSVRRALGLLERLGYLARRMRPGRTLYDFLLPLDPELRRRPPSPGPEAPAPEARPSGQSASGGASAPGWAHGTSGGVSTPRTSGGISPPLLRGASRPPEPSEPALEPKTKNPDLVSRSRSDSGEGIPEPPAGASVEALCRHALDTEGRGAGAVVPRLAALLGLEPGREESHRRVGRFVWDAVRGSGADRGRLLSAARWADKARSPRYRADRPTFLGFTLVAKGDDVPWPVVRGSEAEAAGGKAGGRQGDDITLARGPEADVAKGNVCNANVSAPPHALDAMRRGLAASSAAPTAPPRPTGTFGEFWSTKRPPERRMTLREARERLAAKSATIPGPPPPEPCPMGALPMAAAL